MLSLGGAVLLTLSSALAAAEGDSSRIKLVKAASGEVNALHVNVRSGPSTNYYILNTVDRGTKLTVYSFRDGWYEIALPQGSFLWAYARWIKPDIPPDAAAAPATGTVTAQTLNLRAAANMEATVIARKHRGDKIELLGKVGDWYKVKPPEGTRGWIYAKYVDLEPGVRVAGMPLPGEAVVPVLNPDLPPLPGGTAETPEQTESPSLPPMSDFQRAQYLFNLERRRPALERDFRDCIRLFNKVLHDPAADSETRKSAEAWLKKIFRMVPRRQLLEYMQELAKSVDAELEQIDRRYRPRIKALVNRLPQPRFTARGVLYPAAPGDRLYPYRLKLADVTLYLIRTDLNLDNFVGREVGVIGEIRPAPEGAAAEVLELSSIQLVE